MTDQKTQKATELIPATLENMPVSQKITVYEDILKDQALYTEKLEEIRKKGNKLTFPLYGFDQISCWFQRSTS